MKVSNPPGGQPVALEFVHQPSKNLLPCSRSTSKFSFPTLIIGGQSSTAAGLGRGSRPDFLHARAARRNCLRWEQTRKDAIFRRIVTFEGLSRRVFVANEPLVFICRYSDAFETQLFVTW
jgi:hypothetical protein